MIQKAIDRITEQQKGLSEADTVFGVGEQLKDICRESAEIAELVFQDLENPEMSIKKAEAKIHAKADELDKNKALEKVANLEKQLRMQNPDAMEFKRLFEQLQGNIVNTFKALSKVRESDPELAVKFENAMQVLLKTHIKEI